MVRQSYIDGFTNLHIEKRDGKNRTREGRFGRHSTVSILAATLLAALVGPAGFPHSGSIAF